MRLGHIIVRYYTLAAGHAQRGPFTQQRGDRQGHIQYLTSTIMTPSFCLAVLLQVMHVVDRSPSKEVTDKDLAAMIYDYPLTPNFLLWLQVMRVVDRSPSKEVTDKDLAAMIYHLASILREQVGQDRDCSVRVNAHRHGVLWASHLYSRDRTSALFV